MGKNKKKRKDRRVKSDERAAPKDHGVNTSDDEKKQEASVIDVSRTTKNESSGEASTSTGGKRIHSVPEEHSKSSKKRKSAPKVLDSPVEEQDDKGKNWLSSILELVCMIRSRLDQFSYDLSWSIFVPDLPHVVDKMSIHGGRPAGVTS
jgi:hypothetical protein